MQARSGSASFSHRVLCINRRLALCGNAAVFTAVTKRIDESREIAFDASGSGRWPRRHGEFPSVAYRRESLPLFRGETEPQ